MRVTGVQPRISRTARMSMPYSSWPRFTVRYCDWSASLRMGSDMVSLFVGAGCGGPLLWVWIGGGKGNLSEIKGRFSTLSPFVGAHPVRDRGAWTAHGRSVVATTVWRGNGGAAVAHWVRSYRGHSMGT